MFAGPPCGWLPIVAIAFGAVVTTASWWVALARRLHWSVILAISEASSPLVNWLSKVTICTPAFGPVLGVNNVATLSRETLKTAVLRTILSLRKEKRMPA